MQAYEEGWGEDMFHDGTIATCLEFVEYVTSSYVMFWVVYCGNEPLAFVWLNRIEQTYAYLHFGVFKKWWSTEESVEAGKQVLEMLLVEEFGGGKPMFELILGMLPSWNRHAIRYIRRLGAKIIACEVPHLMWSVFHGKSINGTIVYIDKDMING